MPDGLRAEPFTNYSAEKLSNYRAELSASMLLNSGFQPAAFSFALLPVKSTNISSTHEVWIGDPQNRHLKKVIRRAMDKGTVGTTFLPTACQTWLRRTESSGTTLKGPGMSVSTACTNAAATSFS